MSKAVHLNCSVLPLVLLLLAPAGSDGLVAAPAALTTLPEASGKSVEVAAPPVEAPTQPVAPSSAADVPTVDVCHHERTLTIPDSALVPHLTHGDTVGPCCSEATNPTDCYFLSPEQEYPGYCWWDISDDTCNRGTDG